MDAINFTQNAADVVKMASINTDRGKQNTAAEEKDLSRALDCVSLSSDNKPVIGNATGSIPAGKTALKGAAASENNADVYGTTERLAETGSRTALAAACSTTPSLNLLILGGTGFLGRHLVQAALDQGHNVTLFNRGLTGPDAFPGVENLVGDRKGDLSALKGRTWDAVIDTSAWQPEDVKSSATLLAPNVKHYTFISSASVYMDSSVPGMDESAPVYENGPMHFGLGKALCEKAAGSAMPDRVLNIRPGLIVGPGDNSDRFTYWVERMDAGGDVLVPDCPDRKVQFIDARDLAKWTIKAVEDSQTGTFNAVGPDKDLTMKEVLDECRSKAGAEKSRMRPVNENWLANHRVNYYTDLPLWLPYDESLSSSKAQEAGLTFRPLSETVKDTLDWARGRTDGARQAGLTPERESQLLREWGSTGRTR
ncbi:MAG: NAD-dependent epimerase/dehydratase family protein [Vulcanimicrobiota bacterium]